MSDRAITLTQAAQQLHINSHKLYDELRARKILGTKNIALPAFIRSGDFRIEQRSYIVPRTSIQRWYPVTLVTPKGLSLLQAIVDEMAAKEQISPAERSELSGEQSIRQQESALCRMDTNTEIEPVASTARRAR